MRDRPPIPVPTTQCIGPTQLWIEGPLYCTGRQHSKIDIELIEYEVGLQELTRFCQTVLSCTELHRQLSNAIYLMQVY